jgi:hypothetical protein
MAGGGAPAPGPAELWRYGLEEKPRGFVVLPWRWVVERTFAWLGQARRLSKDYERLTETAGPCVLRRITLPRTRVTRLGTSPRGGFPEVRIVNPEV